MNYWIEEFENIYLADNEIWGSKAAYLADAKKRGVAVPEGFCIVGADGILDISDEAFLTDVRKHFKRLQDKTGAARYIVRSTARNEDRENHIFPGIYESEKNIEKFTELIKAIDLCFQSFRSESSRLYMENRKLEDKGDNRFGVIIQEQAEPEYSGVIFTKVPIEGYYNVDSFLVEMVKGHCQNMLQGKELCNSYIIENMQGSLRIGKLSGSIAFDKEKVQEILEKLGRVVLKIICFYGSKLDIEWGYCKGDIIIFQIRPVPHQQIQSRNPVRKNTDLGMKARAMKKFQEMGLFQKPLLVLSSDKTVSEIETALDRASDIEGPLTVRYSCNHEIGLPRFFASNKAEAIRFINETYNPNWAVIIHESIDVRDSYELYLDENKAMLEHVPGMWESDSNLSVDTWIYEEREVTAYAVECVRKAKYEDMDSVKYDFIAPYKEERIKQIAKETYPYIQIIRRNWPVEKGINFHFVRDRRGKFYFLNHRPAKEIGAWREPEEGLTVIESREDLKNWKKGSILLKIDIKRGQEVLLKEYVPILKEKNVKVYIQFGLSSHPAILLREMGIDIQPDYNIHRKYHFDI